MARERAKKGATSTTSTSREGGEYSIRRRFKPQIDGVEHVAWIELDTIKAASPRKALEAYGAQHGDTLPAGEPLEAVSTRFRLELVPTVERQLVIKWGSA